MPNPRNSLQVVKDVAPVIDPGPSDPHRTASIGKLFGVEFVMVFPCAQEFLKHRPATDSHRFALAVFPRIVGLLGISHDDLCRLTSRVWRNARGT